MDWGGFERIPLEYSLLFNFALLKHPKRGLFSILVVIFEFIK